VPPKPCQDRSRRSSTASKDGEAASRSQPNGASPCRVEEREEPADRERSGEHATRRREEPVAAPICWNMEGAGRGRKAEGADGDRRGTRAKRGENRAGNENSAAATACTPRQNAAGDRHHRTRSAGQSARVWKRPIPRAVPQGRSRHVVRCPRVSRSASQISRSPPTARAPRRGQSLKKLALMVGFRRTPGSPRGRTPARGCRPAQAIGVDPRSPRVICAMRGPVKTEHGQDGTALGRRPG